MTVKADKRQKKEKKGVEIEIIKEQKYKKSVSGKLLRFLIPMTAAAFIFTIFFVSSEAEKIIVNLAKDSLVQETGYNAQTFGTEISQIKGALEMSAKTIETIKFSDDAARVQYLKSTMSLNGSMPSGMYIGTQDGSWIDPSGWKPDADFVITDRQWYKEGQQHGKSFAFGVPYLDSTTKKLAVTVSRKINLPDGRTGVAAADMSLAGIVSDISQLKPMKTGNSMLLDGDVILSYVKSEYNGTKASQHADDYYLAAVERYVQQGTSEVREVYANDGKIYYIALHKVVGTNWTLISAVKKDTVLKRLYTFQGICYGLMLVIIIIISFVMAKVIYIIVSKPVRKLTAIIMKITNGDFTVEIPVGGADEIGVMNNCMRDFVEKMRDTMGEIQKVTQQLTAEAENSKDASSQLNQQATEQSLSMEQIKDAMDGMTSAVTELATNAAELATEVGDLMQQGESANTTLTTLVEKAQNGQRDMENVQQGMQAMATSMSEMNNVVEVVGQSAQKINSIIEMINSIAEQTNLLSLNASIEAARAGEAGRGFAVVASEIGKLASDSAQSTTQIAKIIQDITKEIEALSQKSKDNMQGISGSMDAVTIAGSTFAEIFSNLDETGVTVKNMITKIGNVDGIATSVAAISEEQSASTQEVTATVDSLAVSASHVADESKGVDTSAETVSDSAERIEKYVSAFKI
ncbi:MAG: methyl-accepting chemotaxis protein [Butyrivibrio sp.]|nr:methyl-accepting chemotaxis protein [Butyrivibrio sp.]